MGCQQCREPQLKDKDQITKENKNLEPEDNNENVENFNGKTSENTKLKAARPNKLGSNSLEDEEEIKEKQIELLNKLKDQVQQKDSEIEIEELNNDEIINNMLSPYIDEMTKFIESNKEYAPSTSAGEGEESQTKMPLLKFKKGDHEEYFQGQLDENGNIAGKGLLIDSDGNIFKGDFKDNKFNGKGFFLNKNQDKYIGDWVNGVAEGKGKIELNNGFCYEGEFKNNKKEGKGKEFKENEYEYEGEFKNNEKNGKGKIIFNDKSCYEGDFVNGEIEGNGTTTYNNGSSYTGKYKNGKRNGEGSYTWNNGYTLNTKWKNNEPNGNGTFENNADVNNKEVFNVFHRYGKVVLLNKSEIQ